MKKLLAFIVACTFSLTCFAGCKKQTQTDNGNAGESADYSVNIDMSDEDYNQTATLTVGVTADPYESELVNALGKAFNRTRAYFGHGLFERGDRQMECEEHSRYFLHERDGIFPFYFEQSLSESRSVHQSRKRGIYACGRKRRGNLVGAVCFRRHETRAEGV